MRTLLLLLALLVLPTAARAEVDITPHPPLLYLGLGGGAMVPFGNWAQNTAAGTGGYPGDLPQFSTSGGGVLSAGFAPQRSRWVSLGLELGYQQLGTYAWEGFIHKRGDGGFSASARLFSIAGGGTVDIPDRNSRYSVELHGALGLIFPGGSEEVGGQQVYRYAFLQDTLFGRVGARFVARFGGGWEGYAGLDVLAAPGGVRHRDTSPTLPGSSVSSQEAFTISAIEPALGMRMWFDPL